MYRLIETEASKLSIRQRCRIANISASAYHGWYKQANGETSEDELLAEIRTILEEFAGYGYRRVTKELNRRGHGVNKKAVQGLMQKHHLQRKQKRRFVHTTDSNHGLSVYPNLIRDLVIDRPDHVSAADITYVRLVRGFVYVAVLLDLFSRKVIGWALSRSLHAQLAVSELQNALQTRTVRPGLIHHSDRGGDFNMRVKNTSRSCSSAT